MTSTFFSSTHNSEDWRLPFPRRNPLTSSNITFEPETKLDKLKIKAFPYFYENSFVLFLQLIFPFRICWASFSSSLLSFPHYTNIRKHHKLNFPFLLRFNRKVVWDNSSALPYLNWKINISKPLRTLEADKTSLPSISELKFLSCTRNLFQPKKTNKSWKIIYAFPLISFRTAVGSANGDRIRSHIAVWFIPQFDTINIIAR